MGIRSSFTSIKTSAKNFSENNPRVVGAIAAIGVAVTGTILGKLILDRIQKRKG